MSQEAPTEEAVEQLDGISNGNSTPEDEGTPSERSAEETQIRSRKRKNHYLNPSIRDFNLICGVDITMEEALEMDRLSLVGKIRRRNPTLGKMKEWVKTNWTGL